MQSGAGVILTWWATSISVARATCSTRHLDVCGLAPACQHHSDTVAGLVPVDRTCRGISKYSTRTPGAGSDGRHATTTRCCIRFYFSVASVSVLTTRATAARTPEAGPWPLHADDGAPVIINRPNASMTAEGVDLPAGAKAWRRSPAWQRKRKSAPVHHRRKVCRPAPETRRRAWGTVEHLEETDVDAFFRESAEGGWTSSYGPGCHRCAVDVLDAARHGDCPHGCTASQFDRAYLMGQGWRSAWNSASSRCGAEHAAVSTVT